MDMSALATSRQSSTASSWYFSSLAAARNPKARPVQYGDVARSIGRSLRDAQSCQATASCSSVIDHFPAPLDHPSRSSSSSLPAPCRTPGATAPATSGLPEKRRSSPALGRGSAERTGSPLRKSSTLPALSSNKGVTPADAGGDGSLALCPTLAEYLRPGSTEVLAGLEVRKLLSRPGVLSPRHAGVMSPRHAAAEKEKERESQREEDPAFDDRTLAKVCEDIRNTLRKKMARAAGGGKAAFKAFDLSGTGHVTLNEFMNGLARLGVPWQEITGIGTARDLFKFFDFKKDGVLDFAELFPEEAQRGESPERATTPEFWQSWCKKTKEPEQMKRPAKWQPGNSEEKLQTLFWTAKQRDDGQERRKWMHATMTRLKGHGKSTSHCREICALHLPRGTGEKDQHDVQVFTESEVRACKKRYRDRENLHTRNITKTVLELKDKRHDLQEYRKKLWSVAVRPYLKEQEEEERKEVAGGLAADLLGLAAKHKGNQYNLAETHRTSVVLDSRAARVAVAEETGVPESVVAELYEEFSKVARNGEMLGRKGFGKVLHGLAPTRHWAERDLDAWWDQLTRQRQMVGLAVPSQPSKSPRKPSQSQHQSKRDSRRLSEDGKTEVPEDSGSETWRPEAPGDEESSQGDGGDDQGRDDATPDILAVEDLEVAHGLGSRFETAKKNARAAAQAASANIPTRQERRQGKNNVNFHEFVCWFATSEVRVK